MIKNIQEHHNAEEIEIIRLQNEIKQWKSELNFVSHEIGFYIDIFYMYLNKKKYKSHVEAEYLLDQFSNLRQTNSTILKSCETFHPKLEEMNECEDVQCDHAYISAHLLLRSKKEKHISDLQRLKYTAFTNLKNGIEKS
ncbi:hypothetical protein [Christiangramia echinicola]|uniref:Uncharacterized protein n=1 Tax=Christiangramia echinicola TaxID=279359 RepID=A0A1H1LCH0_9FLAO|nr:hypothetical protein [Christiangramia echinicola]SDR72254.1 hypothetical protein SAMN04488552_0708 [Christiangramia echinicola]